jgi:hypothetical protein
MLYSADNDPELLDWVNFQSENGNGFIRSIAALAKTASLAEYQPLRQALIMLRAQHPEPSSTMRTLITDGYRVTYNESDCPGEIVGAFNRFNATIFDNELRETAIHWASSIQNLRAPGTPLGLLALPEDPISHPLRDQFRLKIPHIFISQRFKGVSPIDEWVLIHEMCHFRVPGHGPDFIEEVKRALDKIQWSVLLGGC